MWDHIKYLIVETYNEWSEDKASQLAASMAYYTVFSLAPLLILSVIIAGQLFDQASAKAAIEEQIGGLVGQQGAGVIREILESASQPEGTFVAIVVSVITLFLGASGVFGQLQDALNTIWEVPADTGEGIVALLKDRFLSFTLVIGVAFLLLVSTVLSAILAALGELLGGPDILLIRVVNWVVSLGLTTVIFALVYKVVPDAEIRWKDVWVGSFFTALLFVIGKWAIGLYLGQAADESTYGAFGSLIALLAWVYYSSQLLFLGAEFTQVYANRFGFKILPEDL